MVESSVVEKLLSVVNWLLALSVGLIIGASLVLQSLYVPFVPKPASIVIGWTVSILTLLGAALYIFDRARPQEN
ncbi:MAG TPA: hypothetical protein VJK07_00565 [Candidatus Nanoarchaeia archaeon]|nr:hypothetical protein [Candidatus Nanoarchaeia archaeon]